ncbi:MAG: YcxB family protein [Ardenticatenaceae bacterium]|nr:YcxB family protein [Anaerolineales bacterium]MCB8923057.1 YcxB family protein [Ardenticatenaceae bacterium]MCB8992078.1 YcxB family protein [Ardenticatenaceae bacterium]MCB9005695.1 YcxB family protein [Ardenticatenaceae bacterium]
MIEAKAILSEDTMMQGVALHYKYKMPLVKWMQAIGLIQLGAYIVTVVKMGSLLEPISLFLTGLFFFVVPFFIKQSVRKNLQTLSTTGQEMHWQMDESTLSATTSDSQFSQAWSSYYEALLSSDGFLLYTQKNGFHWIPRAAFSSEEAFQEIKARIQTAVPKCKVVA